jgi:hypothetical protein
MREGLKLNLQCFHEDVFSDGCCQQICMLQKESDLGAACQLHKCLLSCDEQFFQAGCPSHWLNCSVQLIPDLASGITSTTHVTYKV